MRAYFIRISSPTSGNVLALYTSFNPDGSTNGSALKVEFDIPVYAYGDPAGNAYVKISGVNFADIRSANNLNDADIVIYGGMAKGLPLANPLQAGVLLKGSVFQCFGNWQGVNSSLELMVTAKAGTVAKPVNLAYTWRKGTTLQDAVTQALKIAYPGTVVTGSFSSSLVYTEDQPFAYQTLAQFSRWVADTSHAINPDPKYRGAQIVQTPGGFNLYDGTDTTQKSKEISFLDLIGQPTWLDAGTMQFKNVLRADLNVGDFITMPQGVNVINTVNSFARFRDTTSFQGKFQIRNIRHLGDSRQPSADSWCTVVDTYTA
jgi:hypothetical protein